VSFEASSSYGRRGPLTHRRADMLARSMCRTFNLVDNDSVS
jgi:hypothetical protein